MIYLIRHGATLTSGKTYAGRSDIPLSDQGRQMAANIGEQLSQRPIERILSSPLSRAVDTARPLAKSLGLDIEQDPRLCEIDFGVYEGRDKKELGLKLRKAHGYTPIPDGEALIDVWHRAGDFLDDHQPSAPAAVFGHYWLNRMLFGQISCMDFETACRSRMYRPETGSVIELRF